MTDHEVTVTSGPCGILHITFGQHDEPPVSPTRRAQRAIDRLATDLDLIARAHGSTQARDHGHMAERIALNIEQAQALHHALIDYQQKVRDRGLDLDLLHWSPLHDLGPPLPACPACGKTPQTLTVNDCRMTLNTNVDFTPCGHGFRISDSTMHQLAQLS